MPTIKIEVAELENRRSRVIVTVGGASTEGHHLLRTTTEGAGTADRLPTLTAGSNVLLSGS
jgi:hypothetical protein